MIAPAPRLRRDSPAPREIVAEVAAILATAYLRLHERAVREIEASAPVKRPEPENKSLIAPPAEP